MTNCIIDIIVEESKDGFAVVLKADGHEIERTQSFGKTFAHALAESLARRATEMLTKVIVERRGAKHVDP